MCDSNHSPQNPWGNRFSHSTGRAFVTQRNWVKCLQLPQGKVSVEIYNVSVLWLKHTETPTSRSQALPNPSVCSPRSPSCSTLITLVRGHTQARDYPGRSWTTVPSCPWSCVARRLKSDRCGSWDPHLALESFLGSPPHPPSVVSSHHLRMILGRTWRLTGCCSLAGKSWAFSDQIERKDTEQTHKGLCCDLKPFLKWNLWDSRFLVFCCLSKQPSLTNAP